VLALLAGITVLAFLRPATAGDPQVVRQEQPAAAPR
jgi:hypothetical protein